MKRFLVTGLCLIMAASVVGCSNKKGTEDSKITIGMITDVGGINDGSFNESAWNGLKKAEEELGVEASYLESVQDSDFAPNIETFIDEEVDLILGVGYKMSESILSAAKNYPERNFAIIDGDFPEEMPSNVKNITFKEQEGAFLAGVLAATLTKTDTVGFIGGMPVPAVEKYKYGYMAGVHSVSKDSDKDIEVLSQYANSFVDTAKGKAMASQMILDEADIIFHAAGPVGNGMFEALKEKGLLGIGVDTDQSSIAPETVVTSAVKNLDIATYELAKDMIEGSFKGGDVEIHTLANDGVGISKLNDKATIKEIEVLSKYANKIINEEIVVPSTEEEYLQFTKPQ